jgi:hypothetical protein
MLLVRLIDVLVSAVKILGGRTRAHPALRAFLWFDLLCLLGVGVAAVVVLAVLGVHFIHHLAGA